MRVLQIIDSLNAGGAERMGVNYANALAEKVSFSGLIATRKEGALKNQINAEVPYLFLNKKLSIDLKAVFKIRNFVKNNNVEIIHAHSSSYFIAVLVKLTLPRIKIIWHDHYGSRAKQTKNENRVLIYLSIFFSCIFVVNLELEEWNKKNSNCSKVIFIPNFATFPASSQEITNLKGTNGKRIVLLANLKNPKNHILILKAFAELKLHDSGWSMHFIGKDYYDAYSDEIKSFIKLHFLDNHIYLYDAKDDIKYILSQASVGVLASTEEGFPVTLLEYGLANLAVVSTNVGYCSLLIENENNGLLFNPCSAFEARSQLEKITQDHSLRNILGNNFKQSTLDNYSKEIVIEKLISAYRKIKNEE